LAPTLVLKSEDGIRDIATSLIITEIFSKRHADLLRNIENLFCNNEFRERNFAFICNIAKARLLDHLWLELIDHP
jgi:phage regulator Rha-like protein